jgi:Phosphomannose isomerase
VKNDTITEVLANHEIAPGDVFFLPAGRIHAIGAGSFIAEIQQTSDITYRIYDYGRLGLDGKPRELHIEQAKEATDYHVFPEYKTEYSPKQNAEVSLVSCKYFTTSLLDIDCDYPKSLQDLDSFLVAICVKGAGTLVDTEADGSVHEVSIRTGETVLVPASSQNITFRPEQGGMTCLLSCVQ